MNYQLSLYRDLNIPLPGGYANVSHNYITAHLHARVAGEPSYRRSRPQNTSADRCHVEKACLRDGPLAGLCRLNKGDLLIRRHIRWSIDSHMKSGDGNALRYLGGESGEHCIPVRFCFPGFPRISESPK